MVSKQTPYNMRDGMEYEVVPDVTNKSNWMLELLAAATIVYIIIGFFAA